MVDPGDESDPYRLAEMELSEKKIPFIVRRFLPDGSYEDWKVSDLLVDWNYAVWILLLLLINYFVKWLRQIQKPKIPISRTPRRLALKK